MNYVIIKILNKDFFLYMIYILMKNKFIEEILNLDGAVKRSETFKNLKEISILYSISYHQIRSIFNDDHEKETSYHQIRNIQNKHRN